MNNQNDFDIESFLITPLNEVELISIEVVLICKLDGGVAFCDWWREMKKTNILST